MTVDTDKTMAAEGMVESREHASLARQQRHTTGEKEKQAREEVNWYSIEERHRKRQQRRSDGADIMTVDSDEWSRAGNSVSIIKGARWPIASRN